MTFIEALCGGFDGPFWLRGALVPAAFMPVRLGSPGQHGGTHQDETRPVDIRIENGTISAVERTGTVVSEEKSVDLDGRLLFPMLVDIHAHIDKGFLMPRVQPDGTIDGARQLTDADRVHWSEDDLMRRASFAVRCAYVNGVGALRTHIDSYWPHFERSWRVVSRLRTEWAGRVEIQPVAMIRLPHFLTEGAERIADIAVEYNGLLGGVTNDVDHRDPAVAEATDRALDKLFNLAAERQLDIDLHADQSDDVHAFSLPRIAKARLRARGFDGRLMCSHCVNLALQTEDMARETIGLCRDAGLAVSTMPMTMTYLQDRAPGRTPRWRGVTLVQELFDAGVPVSIGGDNCRDGWYPYGDQDMIDTLRHSVRMVQLDHRMNDALHMVGPGPASVMGIDNVGTIAVGKPASFILFRARNINELMCRPGAGRFVINRGRVVSDVLPDYAELDAN